MITELAAAIESGEPVVLATVVRTHRSVPRRPGSKMLVFADGRTAGTIGGGEMEHRVILEAVEVLAEGRPRVITYELVDPASGDPGVCGGEAEIYLEPYMPASTLFIVGAGHVGRAVSDLAKWLGFRTVVWDDRADIHDDAEHTDVALTGSIVEALESNPITDDTAIVMVTRNVGLDLEVMPTLLTTPAHYIGVMGSRRRWDTTRAGLVGLGVSEADLARVHAPIGVEIKAETPEEIAVSILAEVIGSHRGP
jgi:xanthine dehydrogenase accessory factor